RAPPEALAGSEPVPVRPGFVRNSIHHIPYDVRTQSADSFPPYFTGANSRPVRSSAGVPDPNLQLILSGATLQFDPRVRTALVGMADDIRQSLIHRHRDRSRFRLAPADHGRHLCHGCPNDGKTAGVAAHLEGHTHRRIGGGIFGSA